MNTNRRNQVITAQELIEQLPFIKYFKWTKDEQDFEEAHAKPNAFERDGLLFISSEDTLNADLFVYDTYGEFRPTEPIHPTLIDWASRLGTYFEQYDNASIILDPQDIRPRTFEVFLLNNLTFEPENTHSQTSTI